MRLARLTVLALLALALLPAPLVSEAQPVARITRLGVLSMSPTPTPHLNAALVEGLRQHGWIEGQNLIIERRYAAGDPSRLDRMAGELASLPVDVILVPSYPSTMKRWPSAG